MNASSQLIDFLKNSEGLSLKPYKDDKIGTPNIEYSIGFGHQIKPGEEYLMNGISKAKAVELLTSDLAVMSNTVNSHISVGLQQNQFDSLVHFVYNTGPQAFIDSTLLKKINAKADDSIIASEFRRWVYGEKNGVRVVIPSLVKRREDEIKIWMGSFPFYVKKKW